jgi:flagellar L-ring protein precursor FlgH
MNISLHALLASTLMIAGCSSVKEAKISQSYQVNYDQVVPLKEKIPDGAIYAKSQSGFFLGDRRAHSVGDVLTISLAETMAASKSNDAAIDRNGSFKVALPKALFGSMGLNIPQVRDGANFDTSTESKFAGTGSANQSNSIQGKLTVVVTRVYENGNLWVQGQKALSLNQGEEFVRVSGLIRPEDIGPGNIIESARLAQAQISYTGAGDIHDATRQGWFGRFFSLVAPI